MDESTSATPSPIPKTTPLAPKDHAEAVAIFRSEIVGALTRKELDHGELRAAFRALSQERFRPPGVDTTRRYSVATLERWFYAYKAGGLAALRPARRSDRGHAQELPTEQRQLLLDIRKEHRSASVPLILRTLVADGRLEAGVISPATVRALDPVFRTPSERRIRCPTWTRSQSPRRRYHGVRVGRSRTSSRLVQCGSFSTRGRPSRRSLATST